MNHVSTIAAAMIVAAGLSVGGYLSGGFYEVISVEDESGEKAVWRLDRFSGQLWRCAEFGASIVCSAEVLYPRR